MILHVQALCTGCKDTGGPDGGYSKPSHEPRVMQLLSCTCRPLAQDIRTQEVLTEDSPKSIVPRVMQLLSCTCRPLAQDVRTQEVLTEDPPNRLMSHVSCSYDPARAAPRMHSSATQLSLFPSLMSGLSHLFLLLLPFYHFPSFL